jgi:hypothetical protein
MPTPNEQDEEVYALLLSNKGRCKDLATYRESIIASEREAAADRVRAEKITAKSGFFGELAQDTRYNEALDDAIAAILFGQSASPKEPK